MLQAHSRKSPCGRWRGRLSAGADGCRRTDRC